jgi:hypothetical protein
VTARDEGVSDASQATPVGPSLLPCACPLVAVRDDGLGARALVATTHIVGREVFALRDLAPGELVTFDDNTTERELATPFECRCGSAACVGVVRGAAHLDPAQRAARERWLSDYVR